MVAQGGLLRGGVDTRLVRGDPGALEGAGEFVEDDAGLSQLRLRRGDLRADLHRRHHPGTCLNPPLAAEHTLRGDRAQAGIGLHRGTGDGRISGQHDVCQQPVERHPDAFVGVDVVEQPARPGWQIGVEPPRLTTLGFVEETVREARQSFSTTPSSTAPTSASACAPSAADTARPCSVRSSPASVGQPRSTPATGTFWRRVSILDCSEYTARSRSRCRSRNWSSRFSAAPASLAARTWASSSGPRSPASARIFSAAASASRRAEVVRARVSARVSACLAISSSAAVT